LIDFFPHLLSKWGRNEGIALAILGSFFLENTRNEKEKAR
jgi:hypothetical protein